MDSSRIKQLAGVLENTSHTLYAELTEVVQLPSDLSMEDAIQRLDACKRALAIVNTMKDPADRKKWLSATFVNLNKVRGALSRIMAKEGIMPEQPSKPVAPNMTAPSSSMQQPTV